MSGTIEIIRNDVSPEGASLELPLITLDYGEGECDNTATITVKGETKEIKLRGK